MEAFVNDASDGDDDEDEDYSPTPTYKIVRTARPKKRDAKVTLDSNYFSFLRPSTFDMKRFTRGHPQVFSDEEILQFDASFQKRLSFNFSATRATRKKSELMQEARASRIRDVDLDVAPTSFLRDSTDCHELSRYVLEDVLSCPVGCRIFVCIRSGAKGDLTEESYSNQARHIVLLFIVIDNGTGFLLLTWFSLNTCIPRHASSLLL